MGHDRVGTRGAVQRAEIGELAGRNQYAPCMHAHVAREVLEWLGQCQETTYLFFLLLTLTQQRLGFTGLGQRQRLGLHDRDELGELVAQRVRQIKHPACIANDGLRGHGAERGNLRDRLRAVFVAHVLDHPPAVVLAEINVEVGHRDPLRIQEALEEQRVGQWVEIGDAQRKGNERART